MESERERREKEERKRVEEGGLSPPPLSLTHSLPSLLLSFSVCPVDIWWASSFSVCLQEKRSPTLGRAKGRKVPRPGGPPPPARCLSPIHVFFNRFRLSFHFLHLLILLILLLLLHLLLLLLFDPQSSSRSQLRSTTVECSDTTESFRRSTSWAGER